MKKNTGFKRVYKALLYSCQGIRAAWTHEAAFRQEILVVLPAIIVACFLSVTTVERVLLITSLVVVIVVEILNSAIEAVVDRIGSELHELSGRAKDLGSAAVLISIILAVFTWVSILFF